MSEMNVLFVNTLYLVALALLQHWKKKPYSKHIAVILCQQSKCNNVTSCLELTTLSFKATVALCDVFVEYEPEANTRDQVAQ